MRTARKLYVSRVRPLALHGLRWLRISFVVSFPGIPFVVGFPGIPFVVSLSNHALCEKPRLA